MNNAFYVSSTKPDETEPVTIPVAKKQPDLPRTGVIHIGCHIMSEILQYVQKFDKGIFIEAMPQVIHTLGLNLDFCNRNYATKYSIINSLITNEDDKEYEYNTFRIADELYSGQGSVLPINEEEWTLCDYDHIKPYEKIKLNSIRMATLIEQNKIDMKLFPVLIVDVQGVELEVLKSMDDYIDHVKLLVIEVSTKEVYKGNVLFDELNDFILSKGFILKDPPTDVQCDVVYYKDEYM